MVAFAQTTDFALHDGDRVTFYGDSITYLRGYTDAVEEYVVTRYPAWRVEFHNAGVGGDKVSGGYAGPVDLRLDRDVFAWHPSVVTVMLGMNDSFYRAAEPGIVLSYSNGYRHLVDSLQKHLPDARITLIEPSPYDDVTRAPEQGGFNKVLVLYGNLVAQISKEKGTQLADFNTPVTEFLQVVNQKSPDLAQQLLPDRVHPKPAGSWIMAESLLKSWHAPSLVSSVTLDFSAKPTVVNARNASVADIMKNKTQLRWTETEEALPLPFPPARLDPVLALTVSLSDIVTALDQEVLKVQGLANGDYDLVIDDEELGSFTGQQLSNGINLAMLDTPMRRQSRLVAQDIQERDALEDARFDIIYRSAEAESSPTAAALAAAMPGAASQIDDDARPRPHRFEIRVKNVPVH